jgi:ADP-dependent NAD(P)H-hydrate dehydratase / NAD(P)H-hydrate epimerase
MEVLSRVCSSQEMRALSDRITHDFGILPDVLMENAGRSAVDALLHFLPDAGIGSEILLFAGKGNNAGDAFVAARRLLSLERRVRLFLLQPFASYRGPASRNLEALTHYRSKLTFLESIHECTDFFRNADGPFVIVDGLVGLGLRSSLEGLFYDVCEVINDIRAKGCAQVVSLDIPSGVDPDTGHIKGTSIQADFTIAFGFPKLGHFFAPGATRRGRLIQVDLSLPPILRTEAEVVLLTPQLLQPLLRIRDDYGHKHTFGHVLLIGGSPGKPGAISLAARATHRVGTGLVTVATWSDSFPYIAPRLADETMAFALDFGSSGSLDPYKAKMEDFSALVVGPGLGIRQHAKALLTDLAASFKGPLVLDADALNVIAQEGLHPSLMEREAPTVLTPHPGEMARILGWEVSRVVADPLNALRSGLEITKCVIVLKGAATLVGGVDGKIYLNHYPNDGMATAGSGDVLAGMIGGLLGQGMTAIDAARLGVLLHSLAGARAARQVGKRSMTAADIIEGISHGINEVQHDTSTFEGCQEIR